MIDDNDELDKILKELQFDTLKKKYADYKLIRIINMYRFNNIEYLELEDGTYLIYDRSGSVASFTKVKSIPSDKKPV